MGTIDSIISNYKFNPMTAKDPSSGAVYAIELRKAAEKLGQDINAGINHSFKAKISVSPVQAIPIKKGEYHLSVVVTVAGTHYPSLFKNYSGADLVWLFNKGYHVKKDVWFKNIPNFGYRSAENYIDNAISNFKAPHGIKIESIALPNHYWS